MTTFKRVRSIALGVAAAGLAVTLVVVGKTDPGTPSQPETAGTPQPVVSATPANTPTTGERSPGATRPTPAPQGQHNEPTDVDVLAAALGYLHIFFDRRVTTSQWRLQLAALSTPSHAQTVSTIPRVEVPNVTVGTTTVIRLASSAATVSTTLSDRSVLFVGLVLDEHGWKVSRVVPQQKVVSK